MKTIILYHTEGCHLCEVAEQRVGHVLEGRSGLQLEKVDIAEAENSDQLMERYGVAIPVLGWSEGSEELFWPFEINQIEDFVKV